MIKFDRSSGGRHHSLTLPGKMTDSPFLFRRRKRAQATFTDRDEPLSVFGESIGKLFSSGARAADRSQVLQFYGVGGIGKSRLLRRCIEVAKARSENLILANVDFDDESTHAAHRALLRIRRSAQSDHRLDFKHFDLAYAVLFAKRNPDFTYEKRKLPYLEEAGVAGDVIASFDGLGIVGAVKGIIEQLHRISNWLSLDGEGKDAINDLKFMSEREVEEVLPDFLAFDINRQALQGGPAIILFDTYEKLWHDAGEERSRYTADSWVRRLARGLPNSLFVIAGRERLEWDAIEAGWSPYLSAHLLGNLDPSDAEKFIRSTGISDTGLIRKMIETSSGHPFYLDLCIDAYFETAASDKSEADDRRPETKRELFDRFIRSISPDELALLRVLAPLSHYSLDYAALAAREFHIPIDLPSISSHFRYSFVKVDDEIAVIHEIMRKAILAHTPGKTLAAARQFAIRTFSAHLETANSKSSDRELSRCIRECSIQLSELRNEELLEGWLQGPLMSAIDEFQIRATPAPLLQALDRIKAFSNPRTWPDKLRTAYADMTHLTGQYGRAVGLLDEQLADRSPEEIYSDDGLSFSVVRRLHHRMMTEDMNLIWGLALAEMPKLEKAGRRHALAECAFLLGGNLAVAQGKRDEGAFWLNRAIRISKETNDDRLMVRCLRKVGDFERMSGRLDKAEKAIASGLSKSISNPMRRYFLYLRCTMADLSRLKGDYAGARTAFSECRAEFAELNLEGWLAHAYLGAAAVSLAEGDLDHCHWELGSAQKYYLRTNHAWGVTQVMLLRLQSSAIQGGDSEEWQAQAAHIASRAHSLGYLGDEARCKLSREQIARARYAIPFL